MSGMEGIRPGMQVYGADRQLLGIVDDVRGGAMLVGGQPIPPNAVARIEDGAIYLTDSGAEYSPQGAELGDDANVVPGPHAAGDARDVTVTTTPKE